MEANGNVAPLVLVIGYSTGVQVRSECGSSAWSVVIVTGVMVHQDVKGAGQGGVVLVVNVAWCL